MSGRRGASAGVLRAMGIGSPTTSGATSGATSGETAKCGLCGSLLEFFTNPLIGNTMERCTGGVSCPNSRPHRPRPEVFDRERRGTAAAPKPRNGSAAFAVLACLAFFALGVIAGVALLAFGFFSWVASIICGIEDA